MENAETDLVKCDITGAWVNPDEIIEFQGYRVCAAGKEELLARLRSGEAMPGEMERPSVLLRFGCIFLDGILLGAVGVVINLAVVGAAFANQDTMEEGMVMQGVAQLLVVAIGLAYFTILHGTKGQTIGKMAGKIRVVNMDGSPITMGKALWRAVAYQGPAIISPLLWLTSIPLAAISAAGIIGGVLWGAE